jgi:predicted neuraminidase
VHRTVVLLILSTTSGAPAGPPPGPLKIAKTEFIYERAPFLCRTQQGVIVEAWSEDGGLTWSRLTPTTLPNSNARIDAIRLADGRFLLTYNPSPSSRETLALALSRDGKTWTPGPVLEDSPFEYSYPALIQTRNSLVHLTYTWRRERIKHVVIDVTRRSS